MYATAEQMLNSLGKNEMLMLTDRAVTGQVDIALVTEKLLEAESEINGYLAARYFLPLVADVPALRTKAINIAQYLLTGAEVTETMPVRTRYRDALKFLESVRDGQNDLVDVNSVVVPGRSASTAGGTAGAGAGRSFGGKRSFPSGSLSDYGI